ncbi:MAG: GGDEF/HDGYP domain-containing response regulator [Campylobacterota bacterium]
MSDIKSLQKVAKYFTVLYVEDDVTLNNQLQKYFMKLFKKVTVAYDGKEGLKLYQTQRFDIVITDIKMPKLDGLQMLKQIKTLHEIQRTVIVSAHSEADYFLEAIKLGVDGYILKPIDYAQINDALYKVCDTLYQTMQNKEYKNNLEQIVQTKTAQATKLEHEKTLNYEMTLFALVDMIENRDTYTAGHSHRVAKYSKLIAQQMGYSTKECDLLFKAGILHDIGKVSTPDAVLLKPGKLTNLEYQLIQDHVTVGYQILHKMPMYKDLADIIYDHHEKCDGSGYPKGSVEADIHPLAKIMSVADSFDAMTTTRVYKRKKSRQNAIAELQSLTGRDYCHEVVAAAKIVLQEVALPDEINQNPKTALEQERFAYFFKDQITDCYNRYYLETVLIQNQFNNTFCCCDMFYLHHFTHLNNSFGWSRGDEVLRDFATILKEYFINSHIFRLYGDDFLVLHEDNCTKDVQKIKNVDLLKEYDLELSIVHIDLENKIIESADDVERVLNV